MIGSCPSQIPLSVKVVKNAELKIYKGAPHGMCTTEKRKVNQGYTTWKNNRALNPRSFNALRW
ncbi:MAG: hypothetical protein J2P55_04630 [Rhizobiales bacterium]|nr:hypothetical protein [Hyphomicrobiales bacterium]